MSTTLRAAPTNVKRIIMVGDMFWHSPGFIESDGEKVPLAQHLYYEYADGTCSSLCGIVHYDGKERPEDASPKPTHHYCAACETLEKRARRKIDESHKDQDRYPGRP